MKRLLVLASLFIFASSAYAAELGKRGKKEYMGACGEQSAGLIYTMTNGSNAASCDPTQAVGALRIYCSCTSDGMGGYEWVLLDAALGGEAPDLSAYALLTGDSFTGPFTVTQFWDASHPTPEGGDDPSVSFSVGPESGGWEENYNHVGLVLSDGAVRAISRSEGADNTFTVGVSGVSAQGANDFGLWEFSQSSSGALATSGYVAGIDLRTRWDGSSVNLVAVNQVSQFSSGFFAQADDDTDVGGYAIVGVHNNNGLQVTASSTRVQGCVSYGLRANYSAISAPAECDTFFDSTLHVLCFYNGTAWKSQIDGTTTCTAS